MRRGVVGAAPHIVHSPLQVPRAYLARFGRVGQTGDNRNHARQIYAAMVSFLDDAVANVTAGYKAAGLWDNTLLVMASDNGVCVCVCRLVPSRRMEGERGHLWLCFLQSFRLQLPA